MVGFTDELKRFTYDNRYCCPSPLYLKSAYRKKCFKIYKKHYKARNTYTQWLNSNKLDWIEVVYESFLASIDQFPWLDKDTITEKYYKDVITE